MRSRLHEMCEFLELDGADYRELPPNGGVDGAEAQLGRAPDARQAATRAGRGHRQAKAQLRGGDGKADLKWPGGRAGSK